MDLSVLHLYCQLAILHSRISLSISTNMCYTSRIEVKQLATKSAEVIPTSTSFQWNCSNSVYISFCILSFHLQYQLPFNNVSFHLLIGSVDWTTRLSCTIVLSFCMLKLYCETDGLSYLVCLSVH